MVYRITRILTDEQNKALQAIHEQRFGRGGRGGDHRFYPSALPR
jgi:hypothetical protein